MQVNSRWAVFVTVMAANANEAQDHAEGDVMPNLVAALHTLGGTPYRTEVLRVEDPSDPEVGRWTPMQWQGRGGPVLVEPLTSRRRELFRRRRRLLATDTTGAAAAEHLRLGVTLNDFPDPSGGTAQAALFRYYLCIERIVQALTSASRRARRAEFDADRERIAAQVSNGLASLSSSEKVAAIEEASRELRRSDLRYADLEVREGARVLGLDPEDVEEAARLSDFRGKHLGHSSLAPRAEVADWLEGPRNRAFRLAALVLGRYLDRLPGPL